MSPLSSLATSDATSPSKLWELRKGPRDLLRSIDRFQSSSFYNRDGHYHGASNMRHSNLPSEDPRPFDAQFFNIPPERLSPLILEPVYEAIESSGLVLEALRGSDTAVYVGIIGEEYGNICCTDPESIPTYAATGTARSILSNVSLLPSTGEARRAPLIRPARRAELPFIRQCMSCAVAAPPWRWPLVPT